MACSGRDGAAEMVVDSYLLTLRETEEDSDPVKEVRKLSVRSSTTKFTATLLAVTRSLMCLCASLDTARSLRANTGTFASRALSITLEIGTDFSIGA